MKYCVVIHRNILAIGAAIILICSILAPAYQYGHIGAVSNALGYTLDNYRIIRGISTTDETEEYIASISPAITCMRFDYIIQRGNNILLTNEQVETLDAENDYVQEWLSANIEDIVPAGSTIEQAARYAANYLADHVSYDLIGRNNRAYQGAYTAFTEGRGVCTTFACAFNAMIHYLPFNASGTVDYGNGTRHMDTQLVHNDAHTHIWSAIVMNDDVNLYYDVTFYANTGNPIYIAGISNNDFGDVR